MFPGWGAPPVVRVDVGGYETLEWTRRSQVRVASELIFLVFSEMHFKVGVHSNIFQLSLRMSRIGGLHGWYVTTQNKSYSTWVDGESGAGWCRSEIYFFYKFVMLQNIFVILYLLHFFIYN